MDYVERKKRGDPIGSGITEAGCKVIVNQRLKQSGVRWHRATGQHIVDLRTANRRGIWGPFVGSLDEGSNRIAADNSIKFNWTGPKLNYIRYYQPHCTLRHPGLRLAS